MFRYLNPVLKRSRSTAIHLGLNKPLPLMGIRNDLCVVYSIIQTDIRTDSWAWSMGSSPIRINDKERTIVFWGWCMVCFCNLQNQRTGSSRWKWGNGVKIGFQLTIPPYMGLNNSTALLYDPKAIPEFDAHGRKTSPPRQSHFLNFGYRVFYRSICTILWYSPSNLLLPVRDRANRDLMSDSWKLVQVSCSYRLMTPWQHVL